MSARLRPTTDALSTSFRPATLNALSCSRFDSAASRYREAAVGWGKFGIVLEHALALLGEGRCLVQLERAGEAAERWRRPLSSSSGSVQSRC
jgi:hypothetical protein